MGVQASPGAAAVLGANSWSTVCPHAACSHPSAAAQAAEAEVSRGIQKLAGKPSTTPKNHNFAKFPNS